MLILITTGGDSNLEDYVAALNEPVTLSSLSSILEGLIVVNDDGVFEGEINERFGVQLSLLSGVPDRVTIETSTIDFQIEDNDSRQGIIQLRHKSRFMFCKKAIVYGCMV